MAKTTPSEIEQVRRWRSHAPLREGGAGVAGLGGGLLAVLVSLLGSCASKPPRVLVPEGLEGLPAVAPPAPYRVGPGDTLAVNVFGYPELSTGMQPGELGSLVDGTGHVQLPLVGPVEVGGRSPLEIREVVSSALERYLKNPMVDVAVKRFGSQWIVVLGEVKDAGVYPLDRPMTALEVLALAGGVTNRANQEQVAWIRGGVSEDNLVLLDTSDIDARAAQLVQHGDILFAGTRTWIDRAEAVRDVLPLIQVATLAVSTAAQIVTVSELLDDN